MIKKCNVWGGSRSVRLDAECKQIGIMAGDNVCVSVVDGKITIERIITEMNTADGTKFTVKEG